MAINLEYFNRCSEIERVFNEQADEYFEFHRKAVDQLSELKMKVYSSVVSVSIKNGDENYEVIEKDLREVFDVDAIQKLTSYSRYNPIVWMKRYSKHLVYFRNEDRCKKARFKELLKDIDRLERGLIAIKLRKRGKQQLERLIGLKHKIQNLLKLNLDFADTSGFLDVLPGIFFEGWKMDKTNFLSLLSLNRDLHYWDGPKNETMDYIAALPEAIDYKTFQDAIFIQRIEHDQDCCLFNIYMDDLLKSLDENKELSGKMFDKLQETFGPIPTYTAAVDEFGEVIGLEYNKPNLQVIKGAK
ncbi:hypothetical protein [Bacillus sp. Hm123]|uniref:hypothetical protein n=1 Tax=Bacillus sp. Hm123 TaxID=3450745 RepID=UPI003F4347CB